VLIGPEKLCQWDQLIFYTYYNLFFIEPAGAIVVFGPHVALSLLGLPKPILILVVHLLLNIKKKNIKVKKKKNYVNLRLHCAFSSNYV
jgi:hypothetical protein